MCRLSCKEKEKCRNGTWKQQKCTIARILPPITWNVPSAGNFTQNGKKKSVRFNTYRGLFFVKDASQNMAKTWYIKLRACARVRFFRIFDEAYKCLGSSSIYDNYILCHTSSFFSFRYPVQDWWISVKQECRAALFHSPMQMFHFPAETNFCSLNIISTSCLSSNLLGADATRPSCSLQTSSVLGQPLVTN